MQRITEREEGEETPHYNPSFVAEGDAVLFVVNVGGTPTIRAVDLSSREITTLVRAGVRPRRVPRSGSRVQGELLAVGPLGERDPLQTTAVKSTRYQPVWVDRDGTATPIDPEWGYDPGKDPGFSLSSDGRRLAVSIIGDVHEDIWIKELPRGPLTRLTAGSNQETRPRWTRDGRVTYVSFRWGPGALYARSGDGTGSAELLLSHEKPILEGFLSGSGEWLVARVGRGVNVGGTPGGKDVIGIRPGVDSEPTPLIVTEFDEMAVMLSPDGRWLAYESGETGRNEVYVRPFPGVDAGKWAVSVGGGVMPLWSRDGGRIFYVNAANDMVEVQVSTLPAFAVLNREVLFSIGPEFLIPQSEDYTLYDITPDDERFVMLRGEEAEAVELVPVLNWLEKLKERVPN